MKIPQIAIFFASVYGVNAQTGCDGTEAEKWYPSGNAGDWANGFCKFERQCNGQFGSGYADELRAARVSSAGRCQARASAISQPLPLRPRRFPADSPPSGTPITTRRGPTPAASTPCRYPTQTRTIDPPTPPSSSAARALTEDSRAASA